MKGKLKTMNSQTAQTTTTEESAIRDLPRQMVDA
jgi:hypothetical protein